jgi:hypothetical protein
MEFKSVQLMELTGLTKPQINHLVTKGCIKPAFDDPRRGGVRYYDRENLFEACASKVMLDSQLKVESIFWLMGQVRGWKKFNGLSFFHAMEKGAFQQDVFGLLIPARGVDDLKSRKGSTELNPPFGLKDLPRDDSFLTVWGGMMTYLATQDELSQIFSQHIVVTVINLSEIYRKMPK